MMNRPFLALLRKEFHLAKFRIGMVSLVIILLNFALYLLALRGLYATPLGMLQLLVIFLFALWRGYESMHDEWAGGQATLLLTLPIPGWYHTFVKTFVSLAEVVWYAILVTAGTFVLTLPSGDAFMISGFYFEAEYALTSSVLWKVFFWMIFNFARIYFILISITQIAFVVGRTVSQRRGIAALFGGGVFLWFIDRVGVLLAPAFAWLPRVYGTSFMAVSTSSMGIASSHLSLDLNPTPSGEIAGLFIATILAYLIVGWLLERRAQL
mgnify:CR=1 FL=1